MTKDRLAALKANVNEADIQVDMNQSIFMEDFFYEVQDIRSNIEDIRKCINEIKRLHSIILGAAMTDDKLKDELEDRMAEVKGTAQKVRQKLKAMEANIKLEELESDEKSADLRIRKTQFSYLSSLFTETMGTYNSVQLEHRDKCKKRIQRQLEITGKKTNEAEIERMLETGNPQIFTEGILMETKIAKQTLADIEARHKDIMLLEQSIKEIQEMFIDMALLVDSQGEMIDNIEKNVESTVSYVQQAKDDTDNAVVNQKKARQKRIYVILIGTAIGILFVIFLIIILSIYLPKQAPNTNNG